MKKQDAKDLEDLILIESKMLNDCVNLLNNKILLNEWPSEVRHAFLMALQMKREGKEAYKAFRTARHLGIDRHSLMDFGGGKSVSLQPRCAERIRSNLSSLVKFGAGRYIVDDKGKSD